MAPPACACGSRWQRSGSNNVASIGRCGRSAVWVKLVGMRVYIRLGQTLGPCLTRLFEDMEMQTETVLFGEVPDRAALYGVLARLRDLDLAMLDMRVEEQDLDD
jgi:hypothetical protein